MMKKYFFYPVMTVVAVMGLASCDNDDSSSSSESITVAEAKVNQSGEEHWAGTYGKDFAAPITSQVFSNTLTNLGYYKDGSYVSYAQKCNKSQKSEIETILAKNLETYYVSTMAKVNEFDFSSLISENDKKLPYSFVYNREAQIGNSIVSVHLNVCNPQLVQGMKYVTTDTASPVKSVEMLNGTLNHFNDAKIANVVLADGTSKTLEVTENGSSFYIVLNDKVILTFNYTNGIDQAIVILVDENMATYEFMLK